MCWVVFGVLDANVYDVGDVVRCCRCLWRFRRRLAILFPPHELSAKRGDVVFSTVVVYPSKVFFLELL